MNMTDRYDSFPPVVATDEAGKPKHSWRGLLADYMESPGYDLKEPWNSPKNQAFAQRTPQQLVCPSDPTDPDSAGMRETSYVAVVGPGFIFDPNRAVTMGDITDGAGNTIAAVELMNSGIGWTEPRDITFPELLNLVQQRKASAHANGFQVLLADGSVRFLSYDIDPRMLRGLFTIAGKEPVGVLDQRPY